MYNIKTKRKQLVPDTMVYNGVVKYSNKMSMEELRHCGYLPIRQIGTVNESETYISISKSEVIEDALVETVSYVYSIHKDKHLTSEKIKTRYRQIAEHMCYSVPGIGIVQCDDNSMLLLNDQYQLMLSGKLDAVSIRMGNNVVHEFSSGEFSQLLTDIRSMRQSILQYKWNLLDLLENATSERDMQQLKKHNKAIYKVKVDKITKIQSIINGIADMVELNNADAIQHWDIPNLYELYK